MEVLINVPMYAVLRKETTKLAASASLVGVQRWLDTINDALPVASDCRYKTGLTEPPGTINTHLARTCSNLLVPAFALGQLLDMLWT